MPVRTFRQSDIPEVVDLYWRYLCSRTGRAPQEVQGAFAELYFASPWGNQESPSFVYEDTNRRVVGFLGVTTRQMVFAGRSLRVAFGGNFVVHPDARSSIAAARLVKTLLEGGQDMTFTDSANDISKAVLERMGFLVILPSSIHWTRPLRPASYFAHMISRGIGGNSGDALRLLSRPLTGLLDNWMGARLIPLSPPANVLHQEELDLETLLDCIQRFSTSGSLQPVYCEESLQWLVAYMQRNRRRGDLRKALLRDSKKNVAGWYVYSCHPCGIGEVVRVGSVNGFAADVIRALLRDAIQQEVVAVHGLAQSETLADLSDAGCVFTCRRGWTLAYSRQSDIIDALVCGKAHLSRLDGEWCLNPGE